VLWSDRQTLIFQSTQIKSKDERESNQLSSKVAHENPLFRTLQTSVILFIMKIDIHWSS